MPTDSDYVVNVWFERDRKNVRLETPEGHVIFDLWDDAVDEAITDGFLMPPRMASMSSQILDDTEAWQPNAVAYARDRGLI